MNTPLHLLFTTLRRFRWEIAAWWLASAWMSIIILRGDLTFEAGMSVRQAGSLEAVGACWLIVRFLLSETVFFTQAGWRTRPVTRRAMRWLPLQSITFVFGPPLVLKALAVQYATGAAAWQWPDILVYHWLPDLAWLAVIGAVAVGAGGLGRWILRRWQKRALIILAVAAWLVIWLCPKAPWFRNWLEGTANHGFEGRGAAGPSEPVTMAVRDWMPAEASILEYSCRWPGEHTRATLLMHLPLVKDASAGVPGCSMKITGLSTTPSEITIDLEAVCANSRLADAMLASPLVLHFTDGHYSFAGRYVRSRYVTSLPLCPLERVGISATSISPMALPWNSLGLDALLKDAELMVFVETPGTKRWPVKPPPASVPDSMPIDPIARSERIAGDALDSHDFPVYGFTHGRLTKTEAASVKSLPPGLIPAFLQRHPWSDGDWDDVIKPYLLEYAGAAEKPALLERMTTDPRLGEIFVTKDWRAEAMPLLRGFAKDRITLGPLSLRALAEERDPSLTGDLAALAVRLGAELADLEPALRAQPGLDWPVFAKAAWAREKYMQHASDSRPLLAWWAALEGDKSALRWLAENAARGDASALGRIQDLVALPASDTMAFLRLNWERLEWRPEAKKFAVPTT